MYTWDYDLPKNWKPANDYEWVWYIERVINFGADDKDRLKKDVVKKYFDKLRVSQDIKEYLKFLLYES